MTKKQLINNLKRSSTIIEVVSETNNNFEVHITGIIKESPVPTTKQMLETFIKDQTKTNNEQMKFNKNMSRFMVSQMDFNSKIMQRLDNIIINNKLTE